jgi:thymidylate synthase (FAD)
MDKVVLIDFMGTDLTAVNSARISFQKRSEELTDGDKKLLRYLLKNKHYSVFEHAYLSFQVKAPIFVARQWFRHKSWSFNEVSGRYGKMPEEFFIPENFHMQDVVNRQGSSDKVIDYNEIAKKIFAKGIRDSYNLYETLLDLGVSKELARMALPLTIMTEFYATANLRSIMHFLDQRLDPHAQKEIREYAELIKDIAFEKFPETMTIWNELRGEA